MKDCVCVCVCVWVCVCLCVCSVTYLCLTLWDPMDCSLPDFSVLSMEFSRQEYWSKLPFFSSRGSSQPRDWTSVPCDSCFGRWFLYHWAPWELPWGIRALTGRDTREVILLSDIWGYRKKVAPREMGIVSTDTRLASTLTLNFPDLRTVRISLLFKPPVCGTLLLKRPNWWRARITYTCLLNS